MGAVIIKEVNDFNSKEFEQALHIYSTSFPAVETKPIEKVVHMLKNDENYHLYVVTENNIVVGFSLMYVFRDLDAGLLDYMAVIPERRGSGLGKRVFTYTFDQFCSILKSPLGLLLEIQNETSDNLPDQIKRKRRILFYTKLGAKLLNGVNYLIPPQHGDKPEETYLMIAVAQKIKSFSHDLVTQFINAIYKRVYDYQKNDLIEKIVQTMPKTIDLTELTMVE